MDVPDVKPKHEWCQHARPGCGGCAIYATRPEACRSFHCMWLIDERFPDYWYPAKSKIVINAIEHEGTSHVAFVVDPAYPNRWREEPYFSDIKKLAAHGLDGKYGKKWNTIVMIKDERIPIIGSARLLRAAG